MKAIVVREVGGFENLRYEEVPAPVLTAGAVRVQLTVAGLNFIDIYQRRGFYPLPLPYIPGLEGAGKVVECAPDVAHFMPGDTVAFASNLGAYAQEIVVPAASLVKVPDGVSLANAAAVMLQGMTAHYLACSTFPLGQNSTCLIHAAAGGVGLLLTQIAKLRGATVFGTVSTEQKAAAARSAGVDHIIDYTKSDFSEEILRITSGKKVDVVYDSVGKTTFEGSLACLKPRGMLVSFGQSSGPIGSIDPLLLSKHGSLFLTRPTLGHYTSSREELEWRSRDLFSWIREAHLKISIDRLWPLKNAAAAHQSLESRETSGKVLLTCD
jgi:NADPH2:quinone reductase